MTTPRRVVSLGATGSIGTQAADVISRNPERFDVVGLSATGRKLPELIAQVRDLAPQVVGVADDQAAEELRSEFPQLEVIDGESSAAEVAALECDVVLNGISGAAGLEPTLAALDSGSKLALANKESLIIGGPVVTRRAKPDQIIPVDSEHSALAQALRAGKRDEVDRLILTASGGPFRGWDESRLRGISPEQALSHPTWDMGPLVTINSATLVNKGLELIEAHLLFDMPLDRIEVVVHPQSIVHSMVQFYDGSTLAQASPPDMRLPIGLGLAWPDRIADVAPACDWSRPTEWTFEPVDHETFPAIGLATEVARAGGVLPAIFNGADEVAVAAFLDNRIPFTGIVKTVRSVVDLYDNGLARNELEVADVLAADRWARSVAQDLIT